MANAKLSNEGSRRRGFAYSRGLPAAEPRYSAASLSLVLYITPINQKASLQAPTFSVHLRVTMDPVTIIGTTGAVANIIDVICKTIKSLRDIRERWNSADSTIFYLIAQLNALKAGLSKISEWLSADLQDVPQHYQLVIDLEESITCCRMLITTMDVHISKLNWNASNELEFESRIRTIFEDKAGQDFQKHIEAQISALNLLLTACSWWELDLIVLSSMTNVTNSKTLSEQQKWLETPVNRRVFDQSKDNSSSLFVLRDSSSTLSKWTQSTVNSSKLSRVFVFDQELMTSKVYQRLFRALCKRSVCGKELEGSLNLVSQTSPRNKTIPEKKDSVLRSKAVDQTLQEEARQMGEYRLVIVGGPSGGKQLMLRFMRLKIRKSFTAEELQNYRSIIQSTLVDLVCELVALGSLHHEVRELSQSIPKPSTLADLVNDNFAVVTAAKSLWYKQNVQQLLLEQDMSRYWLYP